MSVSGGFVLVESDKKNLSSVELVTTFLAS